MKRLIGIIAFWIYALVASIGFAQTGKPEAAVSPLASIGNISTAQKQIIFNSLLGKLSSYYDLISQEQFLEAQDAAFGALEDQECTEEQCIRKIQEILQIENMFILQMIREGNDTQLSLTLIDLEKKTVKTDFCEGCKTKQLNQKIAQLVDKIRGERPFVPPPVTTTVTEGVGKVFIVSTPSGADIFLDGQPTGKKTEALLDNISAGKHTLLLRKDNLSKTHEFTATPNKMTSLDLKLELSKASLFVTSTPFKAEVSLDGKRMGKTPIEIETSPGKHQVELRLKGYVPESKKVIVKFRESNQLNVQLVDGRKFKGYLTLSSNVKGVSATITGGTYVQKNIEVEIPLQKKSLPVGEYTLVASKLGYYDYSYSFTISKNKHISVELPLKAKPAQLKVSVSRKDGVEKDDGVLRVQVGDQQKEAAGETQDFLFELPEGEHNLEVLHTSGKYEQEQKTLSVMKGKEYHERFELRPNVVFQKHQSWKWKWGSALGGAVVTLLYSQMEYNAVKQSNAEADDLRTKIVESTSQEEAFAYQKQTRSKIDAAKTHKQNGDIGILLFLGLSGLSTWILLDEPPAPQPIAWRFQATPQGLVSLEYRKQW